MLDTAKEGSTKTVRENLTEESKLGSGRLTAGMLAPDFSLLDADMGSFELSEMLRTQKVVLYFFPHVHTPLCTRLATEFTDIDEEFSRRGYIVVGVSVDDSLRQADFRDEHGLSITLLSDSERETSRAYGVLEYREVDGRQRCCVARSTFIIDQTSEIRHALYDVNPRGHAAEVLKLIKQIGTGSNDC